MKSKYLLMIAKKMLHSKPTNDKLQIIHTHHSGEYFSHLFVVLKNKYGSMELLEFYFNFDIGYQISATSS